MELTSAPGNGKANTQRHSFIAGLRMDRPKKGVFVSRTKSKTRSTRSTKKKILLIVQSVYCEYVLWLDAFFDSSSY